MGDVGDNAHRTLIFQGLGGNAEGAGGVDHVVDQHAGLAEHLADDIHHLGFIGPRTALVDDRELDVIEPLGERAGAHHTTHIGRDHDHVLIALLPGVPKQHR